MYAAHGVWRRGGALYAPGARDRDGEPPAARSSDHEHARQTKADARRETSLTDVTRQSTDYSLYRVRDGASWTALPGRRGPGLDTLPVPALD